MVAMLQEILKHYRLQYIYILYLYSFIHQMPVIIITAREIKLDFMGLCSSLQAVEPIKEHESTSSAAGVMDA